MSDTDPVSLAGFYHSGSLRGECCMEQKTGRKLLGSDRRADRCTHRYAEARTEDRGQSEAGAVDRSDRAGRAVHRTGCP